MTWPSAGAQRRGACGRHPGLPRVTWGGIWPTPTLQLDKKAGLTLKAAQKELARAMARYGAPSSLTECVVVLEGGGFVSAAFVEALMGWPVGWTEVTL